MIRESDSNKNRWIHVFAVTDTQTHKNGYTIYKITSIIFPRDIPETLTSVTVWKRFHDIKRLHRELSKRQKNLKIPGEMPAPSDSTYFKRFDPEVIGRRKDFIITFLDFVAKHPPLFKCHTFFQFFNDTSSLFNSPLHKLYVSEENGYSKEEEKQTGSLAVIIAKTSDSKEKTHNRDDDDSQLENQNINAIVAAISTTETEHRRALMGPIDSEENKGASTSTETENAAVDVEKSILTPMASIESEDGGDYIYEAALEFSRAVKAEVNLEYDDAHMLYKRGVEILLNGSKDDTNEERRLIAKAKVIKYVARADDIFHKILSGDADNDDGGGKELMNAADANDQCKKPIPTKPLAAEENDAFRKEIYSTNNIERPLNQLAKYKVLKILGGVVMHVRCVTESANSTYVIKGVEKPASMESNDTIFLPENVPYMVDIHAFFQSEDKIYLLLRYAEGGRLLDYMENYKIEVDKEHLNLGDIFPELSKTDCVEEEGACGGMADAIYKAAKKKTILDKIISETNAYDKQLEKQQNHFENIMPEAENQHEVFSEIVSEMNFTENNKNEDTKSKAAVPEMNISEIVNEIACVVDTTNQNENEDSNLKGNSIEIIPEVVATQSVEIIETHMKEIIPETNAAGDSNEKSRNPVSEVELAEKVEQQILNVEQIVSGKNLVDKPEKQQTNSEIRTNAVEKQHGISEDIFGKMGKIDTAGENFETKKDGGGGGEGDEIEYPTEATEHSQFLRSSQQLLDSVSSLLSQQESQKSDTEIVEEEGDGDASDDSDDEESLTEDIKFVKLPEASVKQWARELFLAIEGLHKKGILLFDLHIYNLLLGDKGQLLLTYFYQNPTINDDCHSWFAQDEHSIAPERPLTFKSDWWSYGIILYQLLVGVSFKNMHPGRIEIYGMVRYPEFVEVSDSGRDLIDHLITQSPEKRYGAEQIRNHDFFKGTNWEEVRQNGLSRYAKS